MFPLRFCIPGYSSFPLFMTSACVAFLPESDVVDGMQLHVGAAPLRYRCGGGRQATDADASYLQRLTTTTTTHRRCGAPSSHCSRRRPRRRRHCCRMHVASRRQSISRRPPRFCSVNCTFIHSFIYYSKRQNAFVVTNYVDILRLCYQVGKYHYLTLNVLSQKGCFYLVCQ